MSKFFDRTGITYGRLTVLRLSSTKPIIWECVCICGRIVQVKSTNLGKDRVHSTKSCGCLRVEIAGNRYRMRPFEWLYKQHIIKREHWVDLTYEQFLEFTRTDRCHYCDISLIWNPYRTGSKTSAFTNLDRKDNSVGYTCSNLVLCCLRCNSIKSSHLSYEEMVEIGKTLRLMREKKLAAAAGAK